MPQICDKAVLHINTHAVSGGAAIAAARLNVGLRRQGCRSAMYVAQREISDPTITVFEPDSSFISRLRRRYRRMAISRAFSRYAHSRLAGLEIFTDDRTPFKSEFVTGLPPFDLINLHWIAEFIDYQSFFSGLPRSMPLVWTLHDMNPFTGGCHYDNHCDKYTSQCGACPQLGSTDENDLSRQIWQRKQKAFSYLREDRLHIVTPSSWLANEVKRSSLLGKFPVSVIPNGLDTEAFTPRDKGFARSVLGVPSRAKVVFFCADSIENKRKGFSLLVQALAGISDLPELFLLSVGRGAGRVEMSASHLHLGRIAKERLLSLVYSSADLFVIPSLEDNLPNTVLEAFACGTPVVGFAAGGIPEMVVPGETGELAKTGDVEELAVTVRRLLADDELRAKMGRVCRQKALIEYSLERQAKRYVKLYSELVDARESTKVAITGRSRDEQ